MIRIERKIVSRGKVFEGSFTIPGYLTIRLLITTNWFNVLGHPKGRIQVDYFYHRHKREMHYRFLRWVEDLSPERIHRIIEPETRDLRLPDPWTGEEIEAAFKGPQSVIEVQAGAFGTGVRINIVCMEEGALKRVIAAVFVDGQGFVSFDARKKCRCGNPVREEFLDWLAEMVFENQKKLIDMIKNDKVLRIPDQHKDGWIEVPRERWFKVGLRS